MIDIRSSSQRGSTTLFVLLMLIIFSMITAASLRFINQQSHQTILQGREERAFGAADSGIELARWLLSASGGNQTPAQLVTQSPITRTAATGATISLQFSSPTADSVLVQAIGQDKVSATSCQTIDGRFQRNTSSVFVISAWDSKISHGCAHNAPDLPPVPTPAGTPTPTPTAPPGMPTVDLKGNTSDGPITVDYNTTVNFTWTSANAILCDKSGAWTGTGFPASGGQSITVTTSGTYTMVCNGAGGPSAPDSVVVNVNPPAGPVVDLRVNGGNGTTIAYNTAATLTWTSANVNVNGCTASGAWSNNPKAASNTVGESTGPLTSTRTYTLTCVGPGGTSAPDSVTVTVNPPPVPTVDLLVNGANSATIAYNAAATLTWSSTNANVNGCTASGAWSNNPKAANNAVGESTGALTSNRTYTLTCTGPGGNSAPDSVTVTVNPPPPAVNLTVNGADNVTINSGTAASLSWTVTGATSCTKSATPTLPAWSGALNPVANGGPLSMGTQTVNRTYTLSCTGPGGTTIDSATVSLLLTLTTHLAYWNLDETQASSLADDMTSTNNSGTPAGSTGSNNLPQPSATVPTLAFNSLRSRHFDSVDDRIEIGSRVYATTTQPFSVSAWVSLDGFTTNFKTIATIMTNTVSPFHIGFGNTATYRGLYFGSNTSWSNLKTDTAAANLTGWKHIVITYTGTGAATATNFKAYINGTLQTLTASGVATSVANVNRIGVFGSNLNYWNGNIDDVRIYNKVLTQTEVNSLYAGNHVP